MTSRPSRSLEKAYFDSGHSIKAMLEALFTSDFFKDESVRYQKVKNPAEMVVSLLRMVGEHKEIKPGLFELSQEPKYMGQDLMNPPTVEGWHTGREWIDSGTWSSASTSPPKCWATPSSTASAAWSTA